MNPDIVLLPVYEHDISNLAARSRWRDLYVNLRMQQARHPKLECGSIFVEDRDFVVWRRLSYSDRHPVLKILSIEVQPLAIASIV
jgi:hypothetical protein